MDSDSVGHLGDSRVDKSVVTSVMKLVAQLVDKMAATLADERDS